jgi:hypothetical protein
MILLAAVIISIPLWVIAREFGQFNANKHNSEVRNENNK